MLEDAGFGIELIGCACCHAGASTPPHLKIPLGTCRFQTRIEGLAGSLLVVPRHSCSGDLAAPTPKFRHDGLPEHSAAANDQRLSYWRHLLPDSAPSGHWLGRR